MTFTAAPALVVGEALADVVVDAAGGVGRALPGGSPANVALGLGRLGHPVRLATRVGRDAHGGRLRRHLREGGVLLIPGSVTGEATSTATATLDASGAAGYTFDISWSLTAEAAAAVRSGPVAHLHTGSIAAALPPGADTVLAAVRWAAPRATVSYDPNLRPDLLGPAEGQRERVEALVAASDVVKASDEDLAWLYPGADPDATARHWATGGGPSLVVVTRGARGARAWWRSGTLEVPAPRVTVADTIGAGDAFTSALISALLDAGLLGPAPESRARLREATAPGGLPPVLGGALTLAARAAALTCTRTGADPPGRADLAL
ncbi:carbohydrate kinase family protein [Actinacidiphila rubida]|uniref:carbohydrate kinase family protein n=1 Tax=Actinacidiphila rubida TaxID=310780 RepID=UPI000A578D07|nr:carbohydrate kinase [Actinacidiphila rubida]